AEGDAVEGANWAPLLSRLDEFLSNDSAGAEQRILDELPRAIPARRAGLVLPPAEETAVRVGLGDRTVGPVEVPPKNLLAAIAGTRLLWLESSAERKWNAGEQALVRHAAAVLAARESPESTEILERIRVTAYVCSRVAHDFDNILTGVMGF